MIRTKIALLGKLVGLSVTQHSMPFRGLRTQSFTWFSAGKYSPLDWVFGGGSRDRTDGLVVANEDVRRDKAIDSI